MARCSSGTNNLSKLDYLTSTDSFTTAGNSAEHLLLDKGTASSADYLRVSGDGTTVYYGGGGNVYSASTDDGSETRLTNGAYNYSPTPVKADWASPPASGNTSVGDAVAINKPSPHDDFLKRQIDIKLDSAGVGHWEYGWSQSSTTAPSGTLQTSSDVSGRTGVLDYSATNPDDNWYLWVRSVGTGNTPGAWNGERQPPPQGAHAQAAGVGGGRGLLLEWAPPGCYR